MGGRSANYEGLIGTDETELIEFSGESRNYEGETLAETQIDLSGESNNFEATYDLQGLRYLAEAFFYAHVCATFLPP